MPEHTIAENLIRLSDARIAIAEAIMKMGGTVNRGDGYEEFPDDIKAIPTNRVVYGFKIDPSIADSNDCVTYLEDAIGKTPAYMDTPNDTFEYGSWENVFFMPKPCMVYSDGTVAYYLNPDDYTKKADGTASDVANADFDGNAMMEWPLIWYKFAGGETEGEGYFYVANYQVDNTYHCWCNIDSENHITPHFYTRIYNGTGTSKLRSISDVTLTGVNGNGGTTVTQEITRATANNIVASDVEWYTAVWCDRLLINALLILISKSIATQETFGRGLDSGSQTAKEAYVTGTLNTKGLFWGNTTNGNNGVKVFGIENWWGCCWDRTAGCISTSRNLKIKLTYGTADGSTTVGYISNGYISNGTLPDSNSYIKTMLFNEYGYMTKTVSSDSTHYYRDYFYPTMSTAYLVVGGGSNNGIRAGAFCFYLAYTPGNVYWDIAASLSLKPLARKVNQRS